MAVVLVVDDVEVVVELVLVVLVLDVLVVEVLDVLVLVLDVLVVEVLDVLLLVLEVLDVELLDVLVLVLDVLELLVLELLVLVLDVLLLVDVVVVGPPAIGVSRSATISAASSARLYTRTSSIRPPNTSFDKPIPMRSCCVFAVSELFSVAASHSSPST
jgi:hypothetical protein